MSENLLFVNEHYFRTLNPDRQNEFIETVHQCISTQEATLKKNGNNKAALLLDLMKAIDFGMEENESYQEKIQCKIGCNHCCYLPLEVTDVEAEVALKAFTDQGFKLDMRRIKAQNILYETAEEWIDKVPYRDRKCVFLRGGRCSIYEHRPLACRRHNSSINPKNCDTRRGPAKVAKVHVYGMEILVSAFFTLFQESGTLLASILERMVNAEA